MSNFNWPVTPTVITPSPVEIEVNSVSTTVAIDTVTPSNSVGMPVRQLNANGTLFDPSVSQDSLGLIEADTDAIRVSTFAIEADVDALAAKDFATQTTLALIEADTDAIRVSVAAIEADADALAAKDFATQTTLAALAAEDFSTETTLAAMSSKLPATIGQKAKAASLAVSLPSDIDPLVVRSGLVPREYDEIALTYVGSGLNGEGQIATVVYKSATVTVATLTMSYNLIGKLTGIVRT